MPTVIISHCVSPDRKGDYIAWQERIMRAVREQPGCSGTEVIAPVEHLQDEWIVLFRFDSNDSLQMWLDNPVRHALLKEASWLMEKPPSIQVLADATTSGRAVSAIFSVKVHAGREADFTSWKKRVLAAQANFPGHLGTESFPPTPGIQDEWIDIVRFDSRPHLAAWLDSAERKALLKDVAGIADLTGVRHLATGLEGWFEFPRDDGRSPPPWKQALLVLVALYPTVFILRWLLAPWLGALPMPLATLVSNVLSVILLTWIMMPTVRRVFKFWLRPVTGLTNFLAIAAVILALAGMLTLFTMVLR